MCNISQQKRALHQNTETSFQCKVPGKTLVMCAHSPVQVEYLSTLLITGFHFLFRLFRKVQLRATLHGFLMKLHNLLNVTIFITISTFFFIHHVEIFTQLFLVNCLHASQFFLTKNCRFYQIFRGSVFFLVTW